MKGMSTDIVKELLEDRRSRSPIPPPSGADDADSNLFCLVAISPILPNPESSASVFPASHSGLCAFGMMSFRNGARLRTLATELAGSERALLLQLAADSDALTAGAQRELKNPNVPAVLEPYLGNYAEDRGHWGRRREPAWRCLEARV